MKDTKYIAKVELIEKALEAYKKDLIEKIEKLDYKKFGMYPGKSKESKVIVDVAGWAYKQAVNDIIKIIKEG